jgi:N-methylhydantoinase A/oxoprolinase/acetone carboxylase beta subunit
VQKRAVQIIGKAIGDTIKESHLDPGEIPLFVHGGGGGCIGANLADYVGLPEMFLFRQGSVFAAFGSSHMSIMHAYEKRMDLRLFHKSIPKEEFCQILNAAVVDLQRQAFNDMRGEGFKEKEIRFEVELELRESMNDTPVSITLSNPFLWLVRDWQPFLDSIKNKLNNDITIEPDPKILVSMITLKAFGNNPHYEPKPSENKVLSTTLPKGNRALYTGDGHWVETKVYEWDFLVSPNVLFGPTIIESPETTVIVPAGKKIIIDENFNGIVQS